MSVLNRPIGALVPRILKSKKGQALIVGLLLTLFSKQLGIELDQAQTAEVVALIVAYIVGQGVADVGKERVRAEIENGRDDRP